MVLKVYNTLTKKKEIFFPYKGKIVRMYNCGPTVYDYAHIGNFRSFLFADILRRYLEYKGYTVWQVMNITDVGHLTQDEIEAGEDKIQAAAKKKKVTPYDIADFYTKAFLEDCKKLNLKEPMVRPKATEHIQEMIETIKKLIENGHAYVVNGSVYYDVTTFKDYGKLSGNTIEKLKAGAGGRVAHNPDKRNQFDFTLWVNDPEHLMKWTSPWSVGYPGWHIECSVMSMKYLGLPIDIHTGGEDNIFPHHEAEIAQAEGAYKKKFVRYWLHVRHLLVNGQKMSKRLGNFYTIRDLIEKGYSPRAIRYVLISAHYRDQLNFTLKGLEDAEKTVDRIIEFMRRIVNEKGKGEHNEKIDKLIIEVKRKFEEYMDDDLNIAPAIAAVHDFIRGINKILENEKYSKEDLMNVFETMVKIDSVLGLFYDVQFFEEEIPKEIKKIVEEREKARKEKDFKKADELREKIRELGWEIFDTPEGPKLRKKI